MASTDYVFGAAALTASPSSAGRCYVASSQPSLITQQPRRRKPPPVGNSAHAFQQPSLTTALTTSHAALRELGYSLESPDVRSLLRRHERSLQQHYLREFQQLVAEVRTLKGC